MAKILIWKKVVENGEYDLYHNPTKQQIYQVVDEHYGKNIYNVGNKLWLQAIVSEISSGIENECCFLSDELKKNKEKINADFDFVLFPMANIFNVRYMHFLKALPNELSGIKIPIFVVACGIQTSKDETIDDLILKIGNESKEFIRTIYNSGGEFCLRGYRTKEFFDKLGFSSARVTGCPSLYQNGRDLKIEKKNIAEKDFKVSFNGNIIDLGKEIFENYNSVYICQDVYFSVLRNLENVKTFNELKNIARYVDTYKIKLAVDERLKIFNSMDAWSTFLSENNFSMSYGSRIHGSIVPILSGIPALISFSDGRVKEMAEFYDIPIDDGKNISLFEKYCELDYGKFNDSFAEKYDYFHKTLKEFGLVRGELNSKNSFMTNTTDNKLNFDLEVARELFYSNEMKLQNYEKIIKLGKGFKRLIKG